MLQRLDRAQWVLVIGSGTFLGFVLFVYQAFGIYQGVSFSGHTLLERVIVFAFAVSAVFGINEIVLKPVFSLDSVGSRVGWIIWEIWSAGTVTHVIFNYFWDWTEGTWRSYMLLLGEITTVFIVPYLLYFLIRKKQTRQEGIYAFKSENGKEELVINAKHLLYVKAEDNYVSIAYNAATEEKHSILRRKLSSVADEFPSLVRVHRSYLVNPDQVQRIERKPKSITVHFSTGSQVPVSDSYKENLIKS